MSRAVRTFSGTTVPHAACGGRPDGPDGPEECRWSHNYSPEARDAAKKHVAETGHEVLVITETRDVYKREGDR